MEGKRVIVEILAVGVMNHGPSTVERLNREFASWDFRGRPNKSSSPFAHQVCGDVLHPIEAHPHLKT